LICIKSVKKFKKVKVLPSIWKTKTKNSTYNIKTSLP